MNRIYHTWDKWECYPAGFYEIHGPDDARDIYRDFLRDTVAFQFAMARVMCEWPNSCEHYLSNESMNRIAWLGQASVCITHGIASHFRGGFNMLTPEEQSTANTAALDVLNIWLTLRGEPTHTLDTVKSKTEANLY